jgi:preprotein translocase subunit SecG
MVILFTIIHVLVCVFLVIVVLLQSGKAADLAGAFGGMGSQTAFGPRGAATVLSKATTIAAGLFMVTSLSLAVMATKSVSVGRSVLESQKPSNKKSSPTATQPATPLNPNVPRGAPPQPTVTLTPEGGGPSKTIPLDIDKLPKATPALPVKPAPASANK